MRDTINKEKVQIISNDKQKKSFLQEITVDNDDSILLCDLSDIITKHKNWRTVMPRVIPHYGSFLF